MLNYMTKGIYGYDGIKVTKQLNMRWRFLHGLYGWSQCNLKGPHMRKTDAEDKTKQKHKTMTAGKGLSLVELALMMEKEGMS